MSTVDWSKAPEGATHWEPESDEWYSSWMMLNDEGWHWWSSYSESDGWMKCRTMNESRVRAMIPRHPAWNGEGLPPVGVVCEGRARSSHEWSEVVVLAHRIGQAVVSFTDFERLQWCGVSELRPIRTPEQIAAEEREAECEKMLAVAMSRRHDPDVYEAIATLYDAGYRKQEQPE